MKDRAMKIAREIFDAAYTSNTYSTESDFDIDLAAEIIERELLSGKRTTTTYGSLKPQ